MVLALAHLRFNITFERKGFMAFMVAASPIVLGSSVAYALGGFDLDTGSGDPRV